MRMILPGNERKQGIDETTSSDGNALSGETELEYCRNELGRMVLYGATTEETLPVRNQIELLEDAITACADDE